MLWRIIWRKMSIRHIITNRSSSRSPRHESLNAWWFRRDKMGSNRRFWSWKYHVRRLLSGIARGKILLGTFFRHMMLLMLFLFLFSVMPFSAPFLVPIESFKFKLKSDEAYLKRFFLDFDLDEFCVWFVGKVLTGFEFSYSSCAVWRCVLAWSTELCPDKI